MPDLALTMPAGKRMLRKERMEGYGFAAFGIVNTEGCFGIAKECCFLDGRRSLLST